LVALAFIGSAVAVPTTALVLLYRARRGRAAVRERAFLENLGAEHRIAKHPYREQRPKVSHRATIWGVYCAPEARGRDATMSVGGRGPHTRPAASLACFEMRKASFFLALILIGSPVWGLRPMRALV